jgi:hypothetical protein
MKLGLKFFLVISLLTFVSCKDKSTNGNKVESSETGITGLWLLKNISGGIGGGTIYPSGTNLLRITSDNNFIQSRNDTVTFSDNFTISVDSSSQRQTIKFVNSQRISQIIFKVTSDTLALSDAMWDGYMSLYTRVKQ